jgi:hypothetical protein
MNSNRVASFYDSLRHDPYVYPSDSCCDGCSVYSVKIDKYDISYDIEYYCVSHNLGSLSYFTDSGKNIKVYLQEEIENQKQN